MVGAVSAVFEGAQMVVRMKGDSKAFDVKVESGLGVVLKFLKF